MSELPSGPTRLWSGLLAGAGLLLAVAGGAIQGFRPEPSGAIPKDTPLPVLLEPKGELPAPPTAFRWTPGGRDIDVVQVAIYYPNLDPVWQSSPIQGSSLDIDPAEVFGAVAAGQKLFWRVREVSRGRPRATSAFEAFSFATDIHGRGVGESRPPPPVPSSH